MLESKKMKELFGIVTVQIEGFFTERFINLCRINNIKIWDVRNVVKGVIRFKMYVSDFKKIRAAARKTKCKVKIKEKKGLYFVLYKYRKRKLVFILVMLLIIFSIFFSTFIWNIEIEGNETIPNNEIMDILKQSGMYIGKSKIGIDKKEIINNFRVQMQEVTWAGIEIDGTVAKIKLVEKTKLGSEYIQNDKLGDIVANKSGIISKIVPENGTAFLREGSYVEEGTVLIEGTIYSKFLEPTRVTAKGIIRIDKDYEFVKEYKYIDLEKEFTGKTRYTIGITINSKENMLNYLNKGKKYDITKNARSINLFGNQISFDKYKLVEYVENEVTYTKEKLIEFANKDKDNCLNNDILKDANLAIVKSENTKIEDLSDGIKVTTHFVINEQIGTFVERN